MVTNPAEYLNEWGGQRRALDTGSKIVHSLQGMHDSIAIQREMDSKQLGRALLAKSVVFIRSEAHAQALLIHQQASCVGDMAPKDFFLL